MKDISRTVIYTLILSLINFSCNDSVGKIEAKQDGFVIKPEFKKYEPYINDARFKVYLKMGAQKVALKNRDSHIDSLLLGALNLYLFSCEEKYNGLMVSFIFEYNDSSIYVNNLNHDSFTSSVFYRNKNIQDWFFVYGDLSMIYFDLPNQIDTQQVLQHYYKRDSLNPWFKKRIEDSILNNKN